MKEGSKAFWGPTIEAFQDFLGEQHQEHPQELHGQLAWQRSLHLFAGAVGAVPDWACPLPPVVAVPFISFDNSTWLPALSFINLVCSVMVSL